MKKILICLTLFAALAAPAQEALMLTTAGNMLTLTPGGSTLVTSLPTAIPDSVLLVSNYPSLQAAVTAAQNLNKFLALPANYSVTEKLEIHGNLRMGFINGRGVITDNTAKSENGFMWRLNEGTHLFKNIIFNYSGAEVPNYNTIQTAQTDIVYNDSFYNCKWQGAWYNNYQSTSGHAGNRTAFYKCRMYARSENMQYFAQMGPKSLILHYDTLETSLSHCVYSHPINNLDVEDVLILGTGKLGINSYGTASSVTVGTNTFYRVKKLRSADTATSKIFGASPMNRLWSSSAPITIDSSNIAPFEMAASACTISNTNWRNEGNGSFIANNATVINCTGNMTVRPAHAATFSNCQLMLGISEGANVTATNSTITMGGQGSATCNFTNTAFVGYYDYYHSGSYTNAVQFNNCSFSLNDFGNCIRVYGGMYSGFTYNGTTEPCH